MIKRVLIIAGLVLTSVFHVQAQVAESYTITLNNDNGPIEATTNKGDLVVELSRSDIVKFDFKKFVDNSENTALEITSQTTAEKILSRNISKLKFNNKFDLKVSDLDHPTESDDEIYLVSLTNKDDRQLIFRFKIKS